MLAATPLALWHNPRPPSFAPKDGPHPLQARFTQPKERETMAGKNRSTKAFSLQGLAIGGENRTAKELNSCKYALS
jgi:hypothetical protein